MRETTLAGEKTDSDFFLATNELARSRARETRWAAAVPQPVAEALRPQLQKATS